MHACFRGVLLVHHVSHFLACICEVVCRLGAENFSMCDARDFSNKM
jgi:hypothetical protein